jgi:hypothetical protein
MAPKARGSRHIKCSMLICFIKKNFCQNFGGGFEPVNPPPPKYGHGPDDTSKSFVTSIFHFNWFVIS